MLLDLTSSLSYRIFEHASCILECVPDCNVHILVVLVVGHQFMSGNGCVDTDIEQLA
ncbi:hypothetical protein AWB68_08041 [Caballeronia choica]|jgi:hypothetical protein|uniref:Uncharacterized protein n=1 Tax=Caballeronia choica TaxID=326476 RepID=A0A158KZC6_9BURK|nr:hypothetical protein AWB68_08041 [Caballeronia choica]